MAHDMATEKVGLETLLGKTMAFVDRIGEHGGITFHDKDGGRYHLEHEQDCCETSYLYDVVGDLKDLEGSPILMSEEVKGESPVDARLPEEDKDYYHYWYFYRFATVKGYVTVRWCGHTDSCYALNANLFREIG